MRDNVKKFVALVSQSLPLQEPIVEMGALQVEGQEGFADLRPLFPGKKFIGCDMREGAGVELLTDAHCLAFSDNGVGAVLVLDTLEHVENCHTAMEEIYRSLKPQGILVMSSVMDFPVHDYPCDYWRFTPESFELLLKRFSPRQVFFQGNPLFPHTVFGIGIKEGDDNSLPEEFSGMVENLELEIALPFLGRENISRFKGTTDAAGLNKKRYPVDMLHIAYDLLGRKDDEIKKLKEEALTLNNKAGRRSSFRDIWPFKYFVSGR